MIYIFLSSLLGYFLFYTSKRKPNIVINEQFSIGNNLNPPVSFGYKRMWIAVKSTNQEEIAENWGINPTTLDQRTDITELDILGYLK